MQQVALVGGEGPILDRCPNGDGLWFDRGELRILLTAMGDGATDFGPVATYLQSFVAAMDGEAA
jgi:Zn-finger nucleic acid-binding protein